MRNLIYLLLVGLGAYALYNLASNPGEFRQRISGVFGTNATPEPKEPDAPTTASTRSKPSATNTLIQEVVTSTYQNMAQILAPISVEAQQPIVGQVSQMKVRLLAEMPKQHTAAEIAKLQTALQLANVLDQAVTQRFEHVRQLRSTEFAEGIEGTSSSSKKQFPLTNPEERARLARTEFFKRGAERKWDDTAALYRKTIEALLVSLSR